MSAVPLVLSLDFDGVLHHFFPLPGVPDKQNQRFAFVPAFEAAVRNVMAVRPVEIVISSSWRRGRSLDALRSFFSDDIAALVIGKTPEIESGNGPGARQAELEAWLADQGKTHLEWVGIDDIPELYRPGAVVLACPDGFFEPQQKGLLEIAQSPAAWAQRHPVPATVRAPWEKPSAGM